MRRHGRHGIPSLREGNTTRRVVAGRLLLTLLPLLVFAHAAAADLQTDVRNIVADNGLKGATVAVSIRDADTDAELVSINDGNPMIPASNMKLLTTGAALHLLGPDFSFRTKLIRNDDRLIVVADGDPGFGDPELLALLEVDGEPGVTVEQFLSLWVQAVVDRGITNIAEVVVDDRIFDRVFVHPTWPRDQLNRRYCAEVSGLIFHLNVLRFYPAPISGEPPDVSRFEPYGSWIDLSSNRATSKDGSDDGNTFGIARPYQRNDFTFLGNVKTEYRSGVPVTVHDMPSYFARLLADRLQQAGVRVGGWRTAGPDDPEPHGEPVAPLVRTPITTAVTRCNRDSQNLYAEALLKRTGYELVSGTQPGSWSVGAAAVRLIVNERINDKSSTAPLRVADGSGLSRDNRITAQLMTAWLNSFHRDPEIGEIFIDSLAVGGVSGTLENRFRSWSRHDVTIQAKSGYIDGVSCLSGFVTARDGTRRSFSVLVNDAPGGTIGTAKNIQERIVEAIAEDMVAPARTIDIGG